MYHFEEKKLRKHENGKNETEKMTFRIIYVTVSAKSPNLNYHQQVNQMQIQDFLLKTLNKNEYLINSLDYI